MRKNEIIGGYIEGVTSGENGSTNSLPILYFQSVHGTR